MAGRGAQRLSIVVESPDGQAQRKIVAVGGNGRALLAAVDRRFDVVPLGDFPVIFSFEVVYDRKGEERRGIECYEKKKEFPYIDLQDGAAVDLDYEIRRSLRFLRPSSKLPSAPGHLPLIFCIRTEAEFVTFDPQGHLQAVSASASTDPSFVAWLWGVRFGAQMFWQLFSAVRYVSAESGQVFKIGEIPGGPKHFVFALLRDGDRVPRAKVPPDEELDVFKRAGVELRVEEGHVRCVGPPQPTDMDLWDIGKDDVTFLQDFVAAASSAE